MNEFVIEFFLIFFIVIELYLLLSIYAYCN